MKFITSIAIGFSVLIIILIGAGSMTMPETTPGGTQAIRQNATLNTVISSANGAKEITEASLSAHDMFIDNPETEWEEYFKVLHRWAGSLQGLQSSINGLDYTGMEEINGTSRAYISSCQAVNYHLLNTGGFVAGGQLEEAETAMEELNEALKQWDQAHKDLVKAVDDFQEARKI